MQWDQGDKTLIQVDMSTVASENTNMEVMSVYRFLVHLEKAKKITKYSLSYSSVERKQSSDGDGFTVALATPHKFKVLLPQDASKKPSCKSWFGDCMEAVDKSSVLAPVFRWRFERVNAVSKIQKPYVMLTRSVTLEPGKPVEARS